MKQILTQPGACAVRDPSVVKHRGRYYLCYAPNVADAGREGICITCADAIDQLDTHAHHFVYLPQEGMPWSKELWAPELHLLDGSWYIYVACDDGENANHRMYVLGNGSDDPMQSYTLLGKITDPTDKWAIDGNVFCHNGQRYFLWSGWEGDENVAQNIYIAKMADACHLDSQRVLLSKPDRDWEKIGCTGTVDGLPLINEGPFGFHHEGQTYIAYSGSGSWDVGYCIAMLRLVGNDPMNPAHWEKSDAPILCENQLVKGAGHCCILMEEDGTQQVFFHAWRKEQRDIHWDTVGTFWGQLVQKNGTFTIE